MSLEPAKQFEARLMSQLSQLRESKMREILPKETGPNELQKAVEHLRNCEYPERSVRFVEKNGLEALRARTAGQKLEAFLSDEDQSLAVLEGGVGSGKTTLAALAFLRAKETYFLYDDKPRESYVSARCLFFPACEITGLREAWSASQEIIQKLKWVGILVLDDLASTDIDDGPTLKLVQDILCARHDRMLKTVITTNAVTEELGQRYSERVADRLKVSVAIRCGTTSHRKPA